MKQILKIFETLSHIIASICDFIKENWKKVSTNLFHYSLYRNLSIISRLSDYVAFHLEKWKHFLNTK